jgi:hypothetical protein
VWGSSGISFAGALMAHKAHPDFSKRNMITGLVLSATGSTLWTLGSSGVWNEGQRGGFVPPIYCCHRSRPRPRDRRQRDTDVLGEAGLRGPFRSGRC